MLHLIVALYFLMKVMAFQGYKIFLDHFASLLLHGTHISASQAAHSNSDSKTFHIQLSDMTKRKGDMLPSIMKRNHLNCFYLISLQNLSNILLFFFLGILQSASNWFCFDKREVQRVEGRNFCKNFGTSLSSCPDAGYLFPNLPLPASAPLCDV